MANNPNPLELQIGYSDSQLLFYEVRATAYKDLTPNNVPTSTQSWKSIRSLYSPIYLSPGTQNTLHFLRLYRQHSPEDNP